MPRIYQVLIDGMSSPTDLDVAPDGSDLLLMCEQGGSVYAVTGAASATGESSSGLTHYEIGDLSKLMCHNGSRGLVGIAFHPDFNAQSTPHAHTVPSPRAGRAARCRAPSHEFRVFPCWPATRGQRATPRRLKCCPGH